MEFQTLKKSHKKQIIIGALAVCVIGGALTFNLTRAKYKITEEIPLVRGNINYSVPDLRVVAIKTSEDGINYTDVSEVPTSGYILNTTNSICKLAITDVKDNNITIEYSNGKVNFLGVGNKNTRCYLYFDKKITSEDTLKKLNITNYKAAAPDFSQAATTDEGIYRVEDGMYGGYSYYWRGAVTNNYVKFANKCWRIVRINGDGTIRLIYDGTACHANGTNTAESIAIASIAYNTSRNQSNYVGWTYEDLFQRPSAGGTSSNAKLKLETWYGTNIIGTNASMVVKGKYCNDRDVQSGNSWAINDTNFFYAAYKRINTDYSPTLSCPSEDAYVLNIGLLTADEVMYAGGRNANNKLYYLYNGQNYWTMSPRNWYGSNAYLFYVSNDGPLGSTEVSSGMPGLRPVINLRSDVTFSGGDGTLNNPYVVR